MLELLRANGVQEISLVFIAVVGLAQQSTATFLPQAGVVAGGDKIRTERLRVVETCSKFDFLIA